MKLIKFLIIFFFKRNFYLINSPLQYINLVEFLSYKKTLSEYKNIFVGYCSTVSKEQIKYLNYNIYSLNFNIWYLDEIMSVNLFHFIFNFQKRLKRKFKFCLIGDFSYYLFGQFLNKSSASLLLDEGVKLLIFDKETTTKKLNCSIFTVFNIKNSNFKIIKNNFNYIKSTMSIKKKIDNNVVFLLGTGIFLHSERSFGLKLYLRDFIEKNKNKQIIYFPHRLENDIISSFKNFSIIKPKVPIEIFILQNNYFPALIAGFYSTALYNLRNLIVDKNVKIMNINFDLNKFKWDEQEKTQVILFNNQLAQTGVKNFYL
jgi:hypothetical protein